MTRALITGAGGFVGSHILERVLTVTDWTAIAVDSFRHNGGTDRIAAAFDAAGLDRSNPEHRRRLVTVTHDLTVPFSRAQRANVGPVDHMFSIASLSQVEQSIDHPGQFIRNNIDLIVNVLDLARHKNANVYHMSTDEVFGPGWSADGRHRPSSPYAASKAAQEDICYAYQRTYRLPLTVINSANMFGERQSQLAFIPRIIRLIRDSQPVPIHTHNGVPGSRSYLYVRNTADAIVGLANGDYPTPYPDQHPGLRRVHLAGQQTINNLDLAQEVAAVMPANQFDVELVDAAGSRPGYDPTYAGLGDFPGWVPPIGFDEGLRRTVRWALDNPAWLAT